jgi:hypothetical protein
MKLYHAQKARFIGKSLLWSLCLYILCMVAINWDDVSIAGKASRAVPISQIAPQPVINPVQDNKPNEPQSNISGFSHTVHSVETIFAQVVKVVSVFKK